MPEPQENINLFEEHVDWKDALDGVPEFKNAELWHSYFLRLKLWTRDSTEPRNCHLSLLPI